MMRKLIFVCKISGVPIKSCFFERSYHKTLSAENQVWYFESLTTGRSHTAVHFALHQHLTFLSTGYWFLRGTCERLTLNTHSVRITNTLLTANLPSLTKLFERQNRGYVVTATNTLNNDNQSCIVAFTGLGSPAGPVQP